MKPEEVGEFERSFRKLVIVFPAKVQPNEETMAVWVEALADKEIRHIASAVKSFIRGTDDEPTPGKIREIAAEHHVTEHNRRPRIEEKKPERDPLRPYADRTDSELQDGIDYMRGKISAGETLKPKVAECLERRIAEMELRGLDHQSDPTSEGFASGTNAAIRMMEESCLNSMAPQTSSEVAS